MVDEDTEIGELQESLESLKEASSGAAEAHYEHKIAAASLTSEILGLERRVGQSVNQLGRFSTETSNSTKTLDGFISVTERFDLSKMGSSLVGITATLGSMFGALPKASDVFGKFEAEGSSATASLTKSFESMSGAMGKLPGGKFFADKVGNLFESADSARAMENSLISLAATSGNLGDMYDKMGGDVNNLQRELTTYNDMVFKTAQSSKLLMSQVMDAAPVFGATMPSALSASVDMTDEMGKSFTFLDAAIKVATATGQTNSEVADQIQKSYRELNLTETESLSLVSKISQAFMDSSAPIDIVRESITRTAIAFKMYGDNADSAVAITKRMNEAFGDTLGPQVISDLTNSMVSGVEKMDLATKSFISSASGGVGGLEGAFKIDYQLQQGDLAGVMDSVMGAMKNQFGGDVVTLEDANKDGAKSGELLKQVQFLKEVAGVAKTDQEAYKFLDAMKQGDLTNFKEALDGSNDALANSLKVGNDIQSRHTTILTNIQNNTQNTAALAAQQNLEGVIKVIGTDSVFGDNIRDKSEIAREKALNPQNDLGGVRDEVLESAQGFIKDSVGGITNALRSLSKQNLTELDIDNYSDRIENDLKRDQGLLRMAKQDNDVEGQQELENSINMNKGLLEEFKSFNFGDLKEKAKEMLKNIIPPERISPEASLVPRDEIRNSGMSAMVSDGKTIPINSSAALQPPALDKQTANKDSGGPIVTLVVERKDDPRIPKQEFIISGDDQRVNIITGGPAQ